MEKGSETILYGFRLFLTAQGKTVRTIKAYVDSAKYILARVPILNRGNFDRFIIEGRMNGKSTGYLNNLMKSMKQLAVYMELEGFEYFKLFSPEDITKSTFTDLEVKAFLETTTSPRMDVFWTILAFTGARPAEVAGLKCEEVDFAQNALYFLRTKTKHPRIVPIPAPITDALRALINEYKRTYVFGTPEHDYPISSRSWCTNFHKKVDRLGIKRPNLTPYSIRHSLITRLINEDVNILKVMKLVGHRNASTTQGYYHASSKDLEDVINKHPLVRQSSDPKKILRDLIEYIKGFGLEKDERFNYTINETENKITVAVKIR